MLAEERVVTPEGKETRRTEWFYEPESFVPLAKREAGGGAGVATKGSDGGAEEVGGAGVATKGSDGGAEEAGGAGVATKGSDGGAEEVRLWYIVTDHLGTPREMLSEDGSLVWAAEYTTWGSIRRLWQADNDDNPDGNFQGMGPDGNPVYSTRVYGTSGNTALKPAQTPDAYACPIRFQGQWADEETGLYYNRFRYYAPDAAHYISPDPIGLMGGISKFRYSAIPTRFLDPYGLVKCTCCKHGSFAGEVGNSVFTPDDPSKWGLQPGQGIPFNNGIPDFGEFAESVLGLPKEFNVPGLTGHSGKDYQAIVRHMAGEAGVIQKDITDIIG